MRIGVGVAAAMLVIAGPAFGQGQTIGPGGIPMAPGPSQPRDFTPGGIGPGGGAVAPGRAARGVNIERTGPGGTRLAPGPAGNVGTGAVARPQAVSPSSSGLRTTVKSKRRLYRGKTKRRPQAGW
jgi:hypothetical protein